MFLFVKLSYSIQYTTNLFSIKLNICLVAKRNFSFNKIF